MSEKNVLLMPSVFGSYCQCEQLFSLMKNVKSRSGTCLTDEHSVGNMLITVAGIKPDVERSLKPKQCQMCV
jgi:hypothetical protein